MVMPRVSVLAAEPNVALCAAGKAMAVTLPVAVHERAALRYIVKFAVVALVEDCVHARWFHPGMVSAEMATAEAVGPLLQAALVPYLSAGVTCVPLLDTLRDKQLGVGLLKSV